MDFTKFKLTPVRDEQEHLFVCNACGEKGWYVLILPVHLRAHKNRLFRRCTGFLEHTASRWANPHLRATHDVQK